MAAGMLNEEENPAPLFRAIGDHGPVTGMLRWLIFLATVAILGFARSANAAVVDVTGAEQDLGPDLELYEDPTTTMTAEDAAHAAFHPSTSRHPNFGFTRAAIWARVTLQAAKPVDLILDVGREWVESVEMWRIDDGLPVHVASTGARVPLAQRAIPVERAAVPIQFDGRATYLIRASTHGPLDLRATLAPPREYLSEHVTGALFFGCYYGILLGIAAYTLILFANLRDRLQALVAGVLVSYAVIEMCGHGHLSRLLPFGAGWFEMAGVSLAFAFLLLTITMVAADVSGVKRPWLPAAGWVGAILCVVGTITAVYVIALLGCLLGLGATLVACGVALRMRTRHAKQFTVAIGVFAVPMCVTLLTLVGLFPAYPANEYGNHAGAVAMSVSLALVVGDSIRLARKEVGERITEVAGLNDELRFQVASRSRELTEALAQSEGTVAPAALEVGDVFDGRYRVARALGRGGMGAVYEVERARDGRRLALKVVTATLRATQAARFAREAEIGARLKHKNLVSILDVGIAAGATPFLVMELMRGGSLEDKRPRFGDAKWALPILRQIASGLAALHAESVVHRDLKPGNVLLVEGDGAATPTAKISDFGISRFGALDEGADVDVEGVAVSPGVHSPSPRDLTETGAILGTPVYMPPEAWFGPARHSSADVFSFGVLAYELLTGRSPFAVPAVLLVRARQPIPTPQPLDGVDARVASLVLACLRPEVSERPRSKDIAEQL